MRCYIAVFRRVQRVIRPHRLNGNGIKASPRKPAAVERVGAFRQCENLKSVTIAKTVTYVCNPYFEDCNELIKITAAKELLEKYEYFGYKDKEFGLKNRRVEFSFI